MIMPACSACSMIHELELLPNLWYGPNLSYVFKMSLFFCSLDGYLICLLNIMLLDLVSAFSVGTSSIRLIFIIVVSYLLFIAGS